MAIFLSDLAAPCISSCPNIPVAAYTAFGGNKPSGKLPIEIPKINDDYTYSDQILYERGFGLE